MIEALRAAFVKLQRDGGATGMQLVLDKDIEPGALWRLRIYEWLESCPAAVVLISEESLLQGSWVGREFFYLMVRLRVRGDIDIIPVLIGDIGSRVKASPEFKPSQISEVEWISCPAELDESALKEVAAKVCRRLEKVAPVKRAPLGGLARAVALILAENQQCYEALATALDVPGEEKNPGTLAMRLLEADDGSLADAVIAFARCTASPVRDPAKSPVLELCDLLVSRKAPEEAARQLALELAKPPSEARAAFVNNRDEFFSKIYAARSCGGLRNFKFHRIVSVFEEDGLDAARAAVVQAVKIDLNRKNLSGANPAAVALEKYRQARRLGRPAVIRAEIGNIAAGQRLLEAVRLDAPFCGLLLCGELNFANGGAWPEEQICRLTPELDEARINALLGFEEMLKDFAQSAD